MISLTLTCTVLHSKNKKAQHNHPDSESDTNDEEKSQAGHQTDSSTDKPPPKRTKTSKQIVLDTDSDIEEVNKPTKSSSKPSAGTSKAHATVATQSSIGSRSSNVDIQEIPAPQGPKTASSARKPMMAPSQTSSKRSSVEIEEVVDEEETDQQELSA
jgi:hypothetical protein